MLYTNSATARVGAAKHPSAMGQSDALYTFFTGPLMKMDPDMSMSGGDIELASILCKIVTAAAQGSPSRYPCTLVPAVT